MDNAQPRRKQPQARRRRPNKARNDLWRSVPPLPEPTPIQPSRDPSATLRSLGDPPLQGQNAVAQHYLVAVVERAAGLATALAAAAGLLATDSED